MTFPVVLDKKQINQSISSHLLNVPRAFMRGKRDNGWKYVNEVRGLVLGFKH